MCVCVGAPRAEPSMYSRSRFGLLHAYIDDRHDVCIRIPVASLFATGCYLGDEPGRLELIH